MRVRIHLQNADNIFFVAHRQKEKGSCTPFLFGTVMITPNLPRSPPYKRPKTDKRDFAAIASVASLRFHVLSPAPKKRQVSTETCRFQLYSPYGELYALSVRDICFASDMPAGVRGEYNITETVGFNITFCVAKYITPSKTEYH